VIGPFSLHAMRSASRARTRPAVSSPVRIHAEESAMAFGAPTILIMGLYDKLVKQHGSD